MLSLVFASATLGIPGGTFVSFLVRTMSLFSCSMGSLGAVVPVLRSVLCVLNAWLLGYLWICEGLLFVPLLPSLFCSLGGVCF